MTLTKEGEIPSISPLSSPLFRRQDSREMRAVALVLFGCLAPAAALHMRPVVVRRASVSMQMQGAWKVFRRDGDDSILVTEYDLAPGQEQVRVL